MLPASAAAATATASSALRCSGRGTYDAHRGVCECPLGYEGHDCAITLLPACEIGGGRAIPIRSWVLHEFHNRGSGERWRSRGEAVGIGPVPCECLRQLVAAPFLLERSRMIWLHRQRFEVRCVRLPPDGGRRRDARERVEDAVQARQPALDHVGPAAVGRGRRVGGPPLEISYLVDQCLRGLA